MEKIVAVLSILENKKKKLFREFFAHCTLSGIRNYFASFYEIRRQNLEEEKRNREKLKLTFAIFNFELS